MEDQVLSPQAHAGHQQGGVLTGQDGRLSRRDLRGLRSVPLGDHRHLRAPVLDQGFQAVQLGAGGDEGLRAAAAAAAVAAAAAGRLQQRLLQRAAGVFAQRGQQNRLSFQAGFWTLDGREQVDLLQHQVLVFWAQQNHVGLVLALDSLLVLLAQGGGHDDFELRAAVGGAVEPVLSSSVLLPVAAQRILPDEAGVAGVAAESARCVQLGVAPGAQRPGRLAAVLPFPALLLGFIRVALLPVDDQVAALFGRKVAEVAFKGPFLRVDPLVDPQRPLAGAGVGALGAANGLEGLVLPLVLPQRRLVGALEVAFQAAVGVLAAVFDVNVRLQVAFHGAAVVAEVTLVRLLARVDPDVAFQVRVNFELGVTLLALEGCVASTTEAKDHRKDKNGLLYIKK